jgi:hypothetical protein
MNRMTKAMVFDFDGVLHSSKADDGQGDYNFDLIRTALKLGYPVAVSTCASITGVTRRLSDAGFNVYADYDRVIGQNGWNGGHNGNVILVTNMEVHGWIVDDNGFNFQYGGSEARLWQQIGDAELARKRAHQAELTAHVARRSGTGSVTIERLPS